MWPACGVVAALGDSGRGFTTLMLSKGGRVVSSRGGGCLACVLAGLCGAAEVSCSCAWLGPAELACGGKWGFGSVRLETAWGLAG